MRKVMVKIRRGDEAYQVEIERDALSRLGATLRGVASKHARRVALVSNKTVFKHHGAITLASLQAAGYEVLTIFIGDGERFKTWRTAERVLNELATNKFERGDCVVALGGGVVGDLAGFVASLYLRGVTFVNAPTTLLAQIDASIGGKTGVNSTAGKNTVGAFYHPRAVVVDTATLDTLDARDMTAGWCEAIKHGAIGSLELFQRTSDYLHGDTNATSITIDELICAHVKFKSSIVAADEREAFDQTDARCSRRILNFGHTVAHALESATRYRRFRHGEAVGYGMIAAAEISRRLNLLPAEDLHNLCATIACAGRLPDARDVDEARVIHHLAADKKSVAGHLKWILIERLGTPRIVDGRDVPVHIIRSSLHAALHRSHPTLTV